MFSRRELEIVWGRSRTCNHVFPVSYDSFVGVERLAVVRFLEEPLQSTLHQIMQKKVDKQTACLYKGCNGILNKEGACSNKCEQSGVNVVQDIVDCQNCDYGGFPCKNCHRNIFQKQIKQYIEDDY